MIQRRIFQASGESESTPLFEVDGGNFIMQTIIIVLDSERI